MSIIVLFKKIVKCILFKILDLKSFNKTISIVSKYVKKTFYKTKIKITNFCCSSSRPPVISPPLSFESP